MAKIEAALLLTTVGLLTAEVGVLLWMVLWVLV
jgi:hypothetical protein